jgi:hypothetical protein
MLNLLVLEELYDFQMLDYRSHEVARPSFADVTSDRLVLYECLQYDALRKITGVTSRRVLCPDADMEALAVAVDVLGLLASRCNLILVGSIFCSCGPSIGHRQQLTCPPYLGLPPLFDDRLPSNR